MTDAEEQPNKQGVDVQKDDMEDQEEMTSSGGNDEVPKTDTEQSISEYQEEQKQPKLNKKESLKEFLVMKDENEEEITLENEGLDDVIDKDESSLTDDERMLLYEKAMSFKNRGNMKHALLCFLGCLKGLQPSSKSRFTMLPQCLTHVSEIYAAAGDYQKAVEFMQGTKLYYETAIIEAGIQVDQYKKETGTEYHPLDLDPCLDEARRANEYERLSNSCLKQGKFQLALEYCGKATKLRQQIYGDEHHLTVKTLDLFTLIYAEMGKSQYSEAMSKYADIAKTLKESQQEEEKKKEDQESLQDEKTSNEEVEQKEENEVEKREEEEDTRMAEKVDEKTERETEAAEDDEKDVSTTQRKHITFSQKEESGNASLQQITTCQFFIFFIISAFLAILLTMIWCHVTESQACPSQKYIYTQARYWYYFYFKTAATNESFY